MSIKKMVFLSVLSISLLSCYQKFALGIPAFPGAEGFGAQSIGGRGGTVVKVTNLNDSGPGSFREAVEAWPKNYATSGPKGPWKSESDAEYMQRLENTGHRIVVFDVSGIINLKNDLFITYAYLTIAGETSPGGILVTGRQTTITSHDIIIRHMRFRVGSHRIADGADPERLDSLDIWGKYWSGYDGAYNIIIDHCSVSWGVDETFTLSGGVRNTTVQWCIVSEGLSNAGHPEGEHSKGLMVSGKYLYDNSVSLHHNFIAHNMARSPLIIGTADVDMTVDVVNNVIYNFNMPPLSYSAKVTSATPKTNWIHNYVRQGANTTLPFSAEVTHYQDGNNPIPVPLLYVQGNIGSTRLSQNDPDWNVGWYYFDQTASTKWRSDKRWAAPPVTTHVMSSAVADCILTAVGATAPVRDSVDKRVVADFAAGTGSIKNNVTYPSDFPTFATPAAPIDNDNDGMPDSWENSQGLDKTVNDSALDKDNDGYTNIEEYLHYLSDKSYTHNKSCMPGAVGIIAPPKNARIN